MLSIPDMAVLGAVALVLFGPDRLPGVARKAGKVMRDVQNTSQSFIREMERAADAHEPPAPVHDPYALDLGVTETVTETPPVTAAELAVAAKPEPAAPRAPSEPREF